jgi:salicylate hydroxylase
VSTHILIAGAGIGGLGAALALSHIGKIADIKVTVLEQAEAFGEIGAGVQISPNAFKVLSNWGLGDALLKTANFPKSFQVRSTASGHLIGQLEMGEKAKNRYGFPFATLHRADLHALLLNAVRQQTNINLHLNAKINQISEKNQQVSQQVSVTTNAGETFTADVLIGADGLWSRVRRHVLGDSTPRATGHTAWRALVSRVDVPSELQQDTVTAWLAPDSHIIAYPVQQGKSLNIVYSSENNDKNSVQPAYLLPKQLSKSLQSVFQAATEQKAWTRWDLFDRPPLTSSAEMANPTHPRIALLGDAAHPMLPYLAQGAAMALEDAQALATCMAENIGDIPSALQKYAHARWQRNAKVQMQAKRNGDIFHASPPVSWARDLAMLLLGEKLLDIPWLYQLKAK